jgi:hypothetical protein
MRYLRRQNTSTSKDSSLHPTFPLQPLIELRLSPLFTLIRIIISVAEFEHSSLTIHRHHSINFQPFASGAVRFDFRTINNPIENNRDLIHLRVFVAVGRSSSVRPFKFARAARWPFDRMRTT